MSFKFNPITGTLDLVNNTIASSLLERILNAPDKQRVIQKSAMGTCEEIITAIEFTANSVSPTAKATKTFTYSDTTFRYVISAVNWTVVP
jgi:hypothetical protein